MHMELEEAKKLIQSHKWTPIVRTRKGKQYLYARKWGHKEKYITSYLKMSRVTEQQVLTALLEDKK